MITSRTREIPDVQPVEETRPVLHDLRRLAEQVATLVGGEGPTMLDRAEPVLGEDVLSDTQPLYFVGLIGGKEVGKSAIVNALVGQSLSDVSSHGPGTDAAIAYAHKQHVEEVSRLLERDIGRCHIVTHDNDDLARQVLLDLPDIDSHYVEHVELTRRALRHLLYPVWVQSVEKYADRQPRELLKKVAAGNEPRNFVFCLNKADQVVEREGEAAAKELAEDYARRIGQTLGIESPRVWLISARHPEHYDFPELKQLLGRQKQEEEVVRSRRWATQRRASSLLAWIDGQRLEQRVGDLTRLQEDVEEKLADRLGTPLLEQAVGGIGQDPAYRLVLVDELMQRRVDRWPLVNLLHVMLQPLVWMFRRRLSLPEQMSLSDRNALVDQYLSQSVPLAERVRAAFAHLLQAHPSLARDYEEQKLWEKAGAERAVEELRREMVDVVERRRRRAIDDLDRSGWLFGWAWRVLLTLGAAVWFPFGQPLLEAWVDPSSSEPLPVLIVQLFGVTHLLRSAAFLTVYFLAIWLALRWGTARRVNRWLNRMERKSDQDADLSLTRRVMDWMGRLVEPIRQRRVQCQKLVDRSEQLRQAMKAL